MKKAIVSAFLIAVLIVSSTPKAFGQNSSLPLDCIKISEMDYNSIFAIVQTVFSVSSEDEVQIINSDKISANVRQGLMESVATIDDMEETMGATFDSVVITPAISSASYTQAGDVKAEIYLTTEIVYHYDSINDSVDYMAYGESHSLELRKQRGEWQVVFDHLNGFAEIENEERSNDNGIDDNQERSANEMVYTLNGYSVNGALSYAMQYCGFPLSRRNMSMSTNGINAYGSGITHGWAYYNQTYGQYTSDCANYVSQCLSQGGGIPTNSNWQMGTANFISASNLIVYLTNTMNYGSKVSVTSNNVYPGNPVFWTIHSDLTWAFHVGICTGYNTAGSPVICAHTTDVYRVPMSALTTLVTNKYHALYGSTAPVYAGTVLLNSSNQHTTHTSAGSTWYYNDTYHFHVCAYCEYPLNVANHVPGLYNECDICHAIGIFK